MGHARRVLPSEVRNVLNQRAVKLSVPELRRARSGNGANSVVHYAMHRTYKVQATSTEKARYGVVGSRREGYPLTRLHGVSRVPYSPSSRIFRRWPNGSERDSIGILGERDHSVSSRKFPPIILFIFLFSR